MQISWDENQWSTFLDLEIFLKILVCREIMNNENPLETLEWVSGYS
jgi:hypothetical protein